MKRVLCLFSVLFLGACAKDPNAPGFYSYVDETGRVHTVERQPSQSAKAADAAEDEKEASSTEEQPAAQATEVMAEQSAHPFGPFGKRVTETSTDADYAIVGDASQPPSQEDIETLLEEEDERFVVFPGADGQLVRQRYDANKVKAYDLAEREARAQHEDFQWVPDTYVETTVAIDGRCCAHLMSQAQPLPVGSKVDASFSASQAQGFSLVSEGPRWPVRVYELPKEASALVVRSYKKQKHYLHPQLLFLNAEGKPELHVGNVFSKRYPETWARHGYVEGVMAVSPSMRYLLVYLAYAEGQQEALPFEVEPGHQLSVNGVVQLQSLQ